jgi:soluble lytic murein transglycosylase-like protein
LLRKKKPAKSNAGFTVVGQENVKVGIESWLKKEAVEAQKKIMEFLSGANHPCPTPGELLKDNLGNLARTEKNYGDMIRELAKEYGVPGNIAVALAASESGGCADAVNYNADGSVDKGLFQLNNRGLGADYPDEDLFNPRKNTQIALSNFAVFMEKYKDDKVAVIAFKIGFSAVDSLIKKGAFNKDNYSKAELVINLSQKTKQQN